MNIIKASTPMKQEPHNDSELETEILFGEKIEILDELSDWLFCKSLTDNCSGWLKKKDTGSLPQATHKVISKRSFIFEDKNIKSKIIDYLPLSSQLSVKKSHAEWTEISLSNFHKNKTGYVPSKHLVHINNITKNWVGIAENMIGIPYKWGGRDTMGLDCSALLQLSYQNYGQNIPRNTSEQVNIKKNIIYDLNKLHRGAVVFWKGHVAIMIDKINCIHSNAFHMKVSVESLEKVNERIRKESEIIRILDFN